ncbi:hypothetical protein D3C85_1605420 [compost metagenome]
MSLGLFNTKERVISSVIIHQLLQFERFQTQKHDVCGAETRLADRSQSTIDQQFHVAIKASDVDGTEA